MSEFKDFLDQLKVRLTNPLIFSFLISWMVIHWEIILGAFYLSPQDLDAFGCANFLDFVRAKIDWFNGLWEPFFYAVLYTILSPLMRIGVQYLNTSLNKWGNNHIRKVAKEGFIQYELYDLLLEEVKGQRSRFEEIVKLNNELNFENEKFKEKIINLQNDIQSFIVETKDLNTKLKLVFDNSIIIGKWKKTISKKGEDNSIKYIRIKNGKIEEKQEDNTYFTTSYLTSFFKDNKDSYNFIERNVSFENPTREFNIITGLKESGNNKLIGELNGNWKIELEKIPD
jgi:hypothetical protein